MSDNQTAIAKIILGMTFNEVMEIAGHFSSWTLTDGVGNDREIEDDAIISRETMAANLIDWAEDRSPSN